MANVGYKRTRKHPMINSVHYMFVQHVLYTFRNCQAISISAEVSFKNQYNMYVSVHVGNAS